MTTARIAVGRIAFALGVQFRDIARRESRSKAISKSLEVKNLDFGRVSVSTPFFWANIYHDGRGPVRARRGHKIVYFKNPAQDPRLNGGNYPVRASQVRRLTKSQFYRLLRDKSSGMIVADSAGPWRGDPFFKRAALRMLRVKHPTAKRHFSDHVKQDLKSVLNVIEVWSVRL